MLSTRYRRQGTSTIIQTTGRFRYLLHRPRAAAEDSAVLSTNAPSGTSAVALSTTLSATPVCYALFDLDGAFHAPPNHLSAYEARRVANTNGPVFLLTIPPSVGYEQNQLSLYYCYDFEASKKTLRTWIAEDMLGNWSMKTNEPGDNLHVVISAQHPKLGNYFTASLTAKRVTPSMSGDHTWFFWLMPHKIALWIYWHALKLWWKSVPLIQHPRYQNPAYKEEALLRDETIRCCQVFGGDQASNVREPGRAFDQVPKTENIRCCAWTDAVAMVLKDEDILVALSIR